MREIDWKPGQSAELTVLGEGGSTGLKARILEFSGKRMRLASERKIQDGAAVRLEWEGQLLLGEVRNAEPGGFWIEIHHMLLDSAGLTWQKTGWQRV
jgi:hypothetical protein